MGDQEGEEEGVRKGGGGACVGSDSVLAIQLSSYPAIVNINIAGYPAIPLSRLATI